MKLLNFQLAVINKALEKLTFSKFFTFQAPIGTGKTFIIANLIEKMIEKNKIFSPYEEFTYIFLAPSTGDLYSQSYEKFSFWMDKGYIKNFNVINNKPSNNNFLTMPYREFEKNSVYFFGWSSLAKKDNKITTEESENNTFWKTLDLTKRIGRKIVLIIDEDHINNTKIGNDFIEKLDVHKIIKMSATISKKEKIDYTITYSMAIEEKIVKRNFIINENINSTGSK